MTIPYSTIEYIKAEADKIHHGKITIELNKIGNKVFVTTENTELFQGTIDENKQVKNPSQIRNG